MAKKAIIDIPRDAYSAGIGGMGSISGLAMNQHAMGTNPTSRIVGSGRGLSAIEYITLLRKSYTSNENIKRRGKRDGLGRVWYVS